MTDVPEGQAIDGLLDAAGGGWEFLWEAGWHRGIDERLYHKLSGFTNSRARDMRRTAAYCRWQMTHPDEEKPSAAKTLGSAIHCAVGESEAFESRYGPDPEKPGVGGHPQGWRNTKDYKGRVAEMRAAGREPLRPDDLFACMTIRDMIHARGGVARDIATSVVETEVTGLWVDGPWGELRCRIRPDMLCKGGVMADLKTARSASKDAWERATYDYGYHRQRELYMRGGLAIHEHHGGDLYSHYLFLVIENTPPFEAAVYEIEDSAVRMAERELERLATEYGACCDANVWPGYPLEIQWSSVPTYAYFREEAEEDAD